MQIYFSATKIKFSLIQNFQKEVSAEIDHEIREEIEEEWHKHGSNINYNKVKKYYKDLSTHMDIEWIGANPDTEVIGITKAQGNYNYSLPKSVGGYTNFEANAFQKILYKDIYPNIDIEYLIKNNGLKYNIIVRPGGDISQVKMNYLGSNGIELDEEGNLIVKSNSTPFQDHFPVSFTSGDKISVASKFTVKGTEVSFQVGEYDKSKTLIIDPWITNPAFVFTNKGYGIRLDYSGNTYVYGGGSSPSLLEWTYEVKKYDPTGVLQWTFTTPNLSQGYHGDITVDRLGNSYIGAGFGFAGGASIIKLSPAGVNIASMNGYMPAGASVSFEVWRLYFNQYTNSNVLYIGGGGAEATQTGKISTTLAGAPTVFNPHFTAPSHKLKDVALWGQDESETNVYSNLTCNSESNGVCADPEDRTLAKASTAAMGTNIWRINNPSAFNETRQTTYGPQAPPPFPGFPAPAPVTTNGLNGLCVSGAFVYTFDGAILTAWNTS